jgi:hypothetical protein
MEEQVVGTNVLDPRIFVRKGCHPVLVDPVIFLITILVDSIASFYSSACIMYNVSMYRTGFLLREEDSKRHKIA